MTEEQGGISPMGPMHNDAGLTKAPTIHEVADDPGKYSGTQYDPVNKHVARLAMQNASFDDKADSLPVNMTFHEAFRALPDVALRAFALDHDGHKLNMDKLSAKQRELLGLK